MPPPPSSPGPNAPRSSTSKSAAAAKLNGSGLSAGALLAASAQASDELARMLAQHDRSRSRERSRSKSPAHRKPRSLAATAMAGDEDPFMVHTASSLTSNHSASSSSKPTRVRSRSPRVHRTAQSSKAAAASSSSSSGHRHRSSSKHRSQLPASSADSSVSLSSTSSSASALPADSRPARSSKHTSSHRSNSKRRDGGHSRSSQSRERERERERERSRSASRPRHHNNIIQPAQATLLLEDEHRRSSGARRSSTTHESRHHRHSSRSRSPIVDTRSRSHHSHSHSHSRTRSRSHSRNRYPDGLAPPLQAVGGGPDHELRARYIEPFANEQAMAGGSRTYYSASANGPMSPSSRLDDRARYEQQARRLEREREDAELRILMARKDAYARSAAQTMDARARGLDSPRYRAAQAYERTFNAGADEDDDDDPFNFDNDANDAVRPEPALPSTGGAGAAGGANAGVLSCSLCEARFEEPLTGMAATTGAGGAGTAGVGARVPRYLLCGHTFCTSCLQDLIQTQSELAPSSSSVPSSSLSLVCPVPGGRCGPTPLELSRGVGDLPVNRSFLDVAKFLRTRRAAGVGLKDSSGMGMGRGAEDLKSEEDIVAELNAELTADADKMHMQMQGVSISTSLPCQQCQVRIAALYCQSCNIRFCAACSAGVHVGRALAEHVKRGLVLPINVARARGLLFQPSVTGGAGAGHGAPQAHAGMMCSTHVDQSLSLYCRTCSMPVCRDCVNVLFHGRHVPPAHDVSLLSEVLAAASSELRGGAQALQGVVAGLEGAVNRASKDLEGLSERQNEVRQELRESFESVRNALLKSLAEREALLDAQIAQKISEKTEAVQRTRAELAKALVGARAAQEEAVRILGSNASSSSTSNANGDSAPPPPDIFSIKALLDVRAAIMAGSAASSSAAAAATAASSSDAAPHQNLLLLRLKPRDLIRSLDSQIVRHGGLVCGLPSPPVFLGMTSGGGTALVVSWAPSSSSSSSLLLPEGETLEYTLDVCELPRAWKAKLRSMNPGLFPDPPAPLLAADEDNDAEEKWNGGSTQGAPIDPRSRAAVNWVALPPGNVQIGGPEMGWNVAGGADWAGAFTTLYSGEATSVKHDNLSLQSAYLYRLRVKNALGGSSFVYSLPCTLPCMVLTYMSDMDSGGLVTYLGSSGGSAPWSSPALSGLVEVTASSVSVGEPASLVSRAAFTLQTLNRHLSWVRVDLGPQPRGQPFRLQISHYTLAHCGRGVGVRRALRNWALQGSLNGTDWVTLREHVNDQSLAAVPLATASWTVNQPVPQAYRFVRILQTDVNHANDHHLALGQIELYGWLVRD